MESELYGAFAHAEQISKRRGLDVVPPYRAPIFADSRAAAPLQAADLLAYETYKEIKGRHPVNSRPISRALQRLVDGQPHFAICLDPVRIFINQRIEGLGWDPDFEPASPLFVSGWPIRAAWLHPTTPLQLRFVHRLTFDSESKAMESAKEWSTRLPSETHYVLRHTDGTFRVSRDLNSVENDVFIVAALRAGEESSIGDPPTRQGEA